MSSALVSSVSSLLGTLGALAHAGAPFSLLLLPPVNLPPGFDPFIYSYRIANAREKGWPTEGTPYLEVILHVVSGERSLSLLPATRAHSM